MELRNLGDRVTAPVIVSNEGLDFRDLGRLTQSMINGRVSELEKAQAIGRAIQRLSFASANLPSTLDPLKNLMGYGGGFCLHRSYSFQILAQVAGLRARTCGHNYGYAHVTNEIFADGKWHAMDLSLDFSSQLSFDEMQKSLRPVVRGDAYGQLQSGTTNNRYVEALYTGETQCYEFGIAPGSVFSQGRLTVEHGDRVEFNCPQRMSGGPTEFGNGDGSIRRILVADSASHVSHHTVPWPIFAIKVRAANVQSPEDFDLAVVRVGGKEWQKLEYDAGSAEWVLNIEDAEEWRSGVGRLPKGDGFEPYMDMHRKLEGAPGFLFEWSDYGYALRIIPKAIQSAPTTFDLETAFIFNPAIMPQLEPGSNAWTYDDDGASGKRDLVLEVEWDEQEKAKDIRLPADKFVNLSSELSVASPPQLITGKRGEIHLVYAVADKQGRRIVYQRLDAGGWSEPSSYRLKAGGAAPRRRSRPKWECTYCI